jgi:hypothetical protein
MNGLADDVGVELLAFGHDGGEERRASRQLANRELGALRINLW